MSRTVDLLDALKSHLGGVSDYQIAKILGCKHQTISQYRSGAMPMSDSMALKVALLMEIDPSPILVSLRAERAKTDEEKLAWTKIYEKLGGLAA